MRIYYSVSNGGDGSAYPTFYENEMLSDMAQSFEEEWGEPCTGFLEIEGDNIVVKNITALRKGAEYAEYTLLFNTLLLISRAMRMKRKFAIVLCNFICSYISSKRNGVLFAFKSAIFNLISNLLNSLF